MLRRKLSRRFSRENIGAILAVAVVGVSGIAAHGDAIQKANNADPLNQGSSWLLGDAPTAADTAVFNGTLPGTFSLGNDLQSWLGIQILNPSSGITISSGNLLTLGAGGIDMATATQNLIMANNVAMSAGQTWNTATSISVTGTISGGQNLVKEGAGTLTLSATNSIGSLIHNAGVLNLNNAGAAGGALVLNGGTINNTSGGAIAVGGAVSLGGNVTVQNTNALNFGAVTLTANSTLNVAAGVSTIGGVISGTGFSLTKSGNGQLNLSVANTFSGGMRLDGGLLVLGNGAALGTGVATLNSGTISMGAFTLSSRLDVTGAVTWATTGVVVFNGSLTGGGYITFINNNQRFDAGSTPLADFSGFTGTLDFATSTGAANVGAEGFRLMGSSGGNNQFVNLGNATVILGTATQHLYTRNAGTVALGALSGGVSTRLGGPSGADGTMIYNIGGLNSSTTFDGTVQSGNSAARITAINKVGTGTLTLTGTGSNYTGAVTVSNGVLNINTLAALGTGAVTNVITLGNTNATTSGTIRYFGDTATISRALSVQHIGVIDASSATGGLALSSGTAVAFGTTNQARSLVLTGTNTALNTFASPLNNNGTGLVSLVKSGTNSWQVTRTNNAYTGGTFINGGTLMAAATSTAHTPLGRGPITVGATGALGGTLLQNGTNGLTISVSAGGAISPGIPGVNSGMGNITALNLTVAGGATLNFDMLVVPAINDVITILDGGSLSLTGPISVNLFKGNTTQVFDQNGEYTLITGFNVSTGFFSSSANIADVLQLANANPIANPTAVYTFSIVNTSTNGRSDIIVTVTGAKSVSKWLGSATPGDWSAAGNWQGGVPGAVAGDTAIFGDEGLGGTINLNAQRRIGQLSLDAGTGGNYTLASGVGGKLFLNNGADIAQLGSASGSHVISTDVELTSNTNALISGATISITGMLSNGTASSSLNVTGSGTLALGANNTFNGPVSIASGATLQIGVGGATGTLSSAIAVSGNLQISRSGNNNLSTIVPNFSGAGSVTQAGPGVLVLNTALPGFTGTTGVIGGTLALGVGGVPSQSLFVGSGGTFDMAGFNATISTLSGGGAISNSSGSPTTLTLTSTTSTNSSTFGGMIAGPGSQSLVLQMLSFSTTVPGGTLTLNGTNGASSAVSKILIAENGSISGGTLQVLTSNALNPGTQIEIQSTATGPTTARSVLTLGDGVNLANNIYMNINNFDGNAEFTNVLAGGSATLSGNIYTDAAPQAASYNDVVRSSFRFGSGASNSTLTLTGAISATGATYNPVLIGGAAGNIILTNATVNSGASEIYFGRTAGATINVTMNGMTTVTAAVFNSQEGASLGGTTPVATTNVSLTLRDNAVLDVGDGNFNLNNGAAATTTTLRLLDNSRLRMFGMTKVSTGASTIIVDGATLEATGFNGSFIAAITGTTMTIGLNGLKVDTTSNGYGIGLNQVMASGGGTNNTDGGLTILGPGVVTLGAANTYRGDTFVGSGQLANSADNGVPSMSVVRIHNGGIWTLNGLSNTFGGLDDSGGSPAFVNTFNVLTFNTVRNQVYTFAGSLTGGIGLGKSGGGTQVLTGAIGITSGFNMGGGHLIIGSASTPSILINTFGTLQFTGGESTLQSTLGNSGNAGILLGNPIARAANATGNYVISGGVNGVTNQILFQSFFDPVGFVDQGTFFNGADYAYMAAPVAGQGLVRAPVYGGDAGFVAAGASLSAGAHNVMNASISQGSVNVLTLKLNGSVNLNQSGGSLTLDRGGILATGGSSAISGGSIYGNATANNNELVIRVNGAGDVLTLNSMILDNSLTPGTSATTHLIKSGGGSLVLTAANPFAGVVHNNAGKIVITNSLALQKAILDFANDRFGTYEFNGITSATVGGFLSGPGGGGVGTTNNLVLENNLGQALALTVAEDGTWGTLNGNGTERITGLGGVVSGSGSIIVNITPNAIPTRFELYVANTFTGGLTVQNGIFVAQQVTMGANSLNTSIGMGTLTLAGGTFRTYGNATATLFNNNVRIEDNTSSTLTTAGATTFAGSFFGAGTVTRTGAGALTLNNTSNAAFTGTFISTAGNITFSNAGAGSAGADWQFNSASVFTLNAPGGTFQFGQLSSTAGTLTSTAGPVVLEVGARNGNSTLAGLVTGSITLTKVGTGTLTLAIPNTYNYASTLNTNTTLNNVGTSIRNGAIVVTNATGLGTLAVGLGNGTSSNDNASLLLGGGINVANAITAVAGGSGVHTVGNVSLASATFSGNITLNHAVSLSQVPGGTMTLSGVVSGASPITAVGPGRIILSGANTFTGGLTVNGAQLFVNGSTVAASAVNVTSGSFGGSGTVNGVITVASGARLAPGGPVGTGTLRTANVILNSGANLDLDFNDLVAGGDQLTLLGSTSLTLGATVNVNLFNANSTVPYFVNGTYTIANVSTVNGTVGTSLVAANVPGVTVTFVQNASTISMTIAGGVNHGVWNVNTDGTWTTSTNWAGNFLPNGTGNIADFGSIITANRQVAMEGNKILSVLRFNNTAASYTVIPGVSAGTLFLQSGSSSSAGVLVTGSHTVSVPVQLDAPTSIILGNTTSKLLLTGNISGGGSLNVSGGGTVALTGTATHSGGTTIAANGRLAIGDGGAAGTLNGAVSNAGVLAFNRSDAWNYNHDGLTGAGTLTSTGAGITTLSGFAILTNTLQTGTGTIRLQNANILGNVVFAGSGGLDVAGKAQTLSPFSGAGGVLLNSGAATTLTLGQTAASTFGGTITGPLHFLKNGTGTITVTGRNTSTGFFQLDAGQLIVGTVAADAAWGAGLNVGTSNGADSVVLLNNNAVFSAPVRIQTGLGDFNWFNIVNGTSVATLGSNVTHDSFISSYRIGLTNAGTVTLTGNHNIDATATSFQITRGNLITNGGSLAYAGNSIFIGRSGANTLNFTVGGTTVVSSMAVQGTEGMNFGGDESAGATTVNMTIRDTSLVRVGATGTANFNLSAMGSAAAITTLNHVGGTLALGQFTRTAVMFFPGTGIPVSSSKVNLSGGTIVAGIGGTDLIPSTLGPEVKVSVNGGTIDLNNKSITISKQLVSTATGTNNTDNGLRLTSTGGVGTLTMTTNPIYKGTTTLGTNSVLLASSNAGLGDENTGGALVLNGGTFRTSDSFALNNNGKNISNTLTHRYDFTALNESGQVADLVGTAHGTPVNSTLTGTGQISFVVAANSNSRVELPGEGPDFASAIRVNAHEAITFMTWYTPNSTTAMANNATLIAAGGRNAENEGIQYIMVAPQSGAAGAGAGNIRAIFTNGGNTGTVDGAANVAETHASTANANFTAGAHQLAVTIDGGNMTLYVDGVLRTTTPLNNAIGSGLLSGISNERFWLNGSMWNADPSAAILMDEFRIYNAALSSADVAAAFAAGPNSLGAASLVHRNITLQAAGGTIDLVAANTLTVTGQINGSGPLNLTGTGSTLLVSGAANYTGNTSIGAGATARFTSAVNHGAGSFSGSGTLRVDAGTNLTSNGVRTTGLWQIDGNHTIRFGQADLSTSKVSTIPTIAATSRLDLTDSIMILQTTGAADKTAKINALNALITSGSGTGSSWTGTGITSSSAQGVNSANYAVGVFDNGLLLKTTFGGQNTDPSSLIVAVARIGDSNRDGIVDINDLGNLANKWQQAGDTWDEGDFNRSGFVDINDLGLLASNWQQTSLFSLALDSFAAIFSGSVASTNVPEPASLAVLAIGGAALLVRRRRR